MVKGLVLNLGNLTLLVWSKWLLFWISFQESISCELINVVLLKPSILEESYLDNILLAKLSVGNSKSGPYNSNSLIPTSIPLVSFVLFITNL